MKCEHIGYAAGHVIGLLIYSALDDKIRAGVSRMTARRDVYDKGFADGYDRAVGERARSVPRPIVVPRRG